MLVGIGSVRAGELAGVVDPDGKTTWYDGRDLGVEGRGWTNTASCYDRLPSDSQGRIPDSVWQLGHDSAGLCVRFTTDSESIQVRWTLLKGRLAMAHMPATGVSGIDLYTRDSEGRWRFTGNGRPTAVTNNATFAVRPGAENMLYLPLYNGVESVMIGIPGERGLARPSPSPRDRIKPVVFYGTSITQGGCASRPGMACAAIVGRRLDVPVLNLGFDASGKMEPEMASLLAELDPSAYVLDCLWNMTGQMVSERVAPFVRTLRQARPGTPIFLVEDSNFRNITPTGMGRRLREIHEQLKAEGVEQLYFVANEGMLGDDSDGTVDGCHPNDLGMMRQAAVMVRMLSPILQDQRR
jgi:hypothetical protein